MLCISWNHLIFNTANIKFLVWSWTCVDWGIIIITSVIVYFCNLFAVNRVTFLRTYLLFVTFLSTWVAGHRFSKMNVSGYMSRHSIKPTWSVASSVWVYLWWVEGYDVWPSGDVWHCGMVGLLSCSFCSFPAFCLGTDENAALNHDYLNDLVWYTHLCLLLSVGMVLLHLLHCHSFGSLFMFVQAISYEVSIIYWVINWYKNWCIVYKCTS